MSRSSSRGSSTRPSTWFTGRGPRPTSSSAGGTPAGARRACRTHSTSSSRSRSRSAERTPAPRATGTHHPVVRWAGRLEGMRRPTQDATDYEEQLMTTLVTGTDFITVATRDIIAAERFYGDVLGLPLSKRWGRMPAAEFETGTLTIAVMQSEAFGME